MHFNWNKNESAFLVECNFNVYAFKITVSIQSEPTADRLANRLSGFTFLDPKMLCVGPDNFSIDNFVISINRVESGFNRAVGSLKYNWAFFVPLDVFENVFRGVLQPILRPTGFSQLSLLEMHTYQ